MAEKTATDLIEQLEQIDRFYDDPDAEGIVPLDLLAGRGVPMPPSSELGDEALHQNLWEVIDAMASLGMVLDSTDHLSDRELYDYLRDEALREPTILFPDDPAFAEHISPIGGCSEEDIQVYLRYYADDETREQWLEDSPGETIPEKEPPPYDRDRFLPGHEERVTGIAH